jgi:hypothetical protein
MTASFSSMFSSVIEPQSIHHCMFFNSDFSLFAFGWVVFGEEREGLSYRGWLLMR